MDAYSMRDGLWVRCPACREWVEAPGENRISTPLFVATCPGCGLEFDWRLAYGKDFLRGATLAWEEYLAPSEVWDHDHCVYCQQKLMEADLPGVERAGFVAYTPGETWWVCRQCFDDLGEEMGWRIEPSDEVSG
jgi:hypothetical protein